MSEAGAGALARRSPAAARLLPRGAYYGWAIVAACGSLMFVSVGVGYYGLAVYLGPLQEIHGWSNAQVSLATGIYFAVAGPMSALVGPRIDRHGPTRWLTLGLILIGTASMGVGQVREYWQLIALYAVLAAGSGMSAGVAVNAIIARWFLHRRAWAMAMASTGVSLGGVVLSPVNGFLIDRWGLEWATPAMGALILLVGLPIVAWVLVWDPKQMDLPQDGLSFRPPATAKESLSASVQTRIWTLRQATRTPAFWAILLSFVIVLLAQTGFILHQVDFLRERLGSLTAATVTLSVTAAGSIIARLVVGYLWADRFDKRWLAMWLFMIQGAAALLVIHVDHPAATWVGILIFGFTIGNVYMMQSLLVSEVFGYVSFGAVFGLIVLATQVSSGVGPLLIGILEDVFGSYAAPLTLTALLTFAAALPLPLARAPRLRQHPPPPPRMRLPARMAAQRNHPTPL